jgi:hypothetical protein
MPHLGTSLFDHKAITLSLNSDKTKSKVYINPSVFSYPRTDDIVWAAVVDTYLNHAVPDQEMPVERGVHVHHARHEDRIGAEKLKVGNLFRLIAEYNALHEQKILDGNNARLDLELAAKNTEVRIHRDSMWDIDVLTRLALNATDEFFLEGLLSKV